MNSVMARTPDFSKWISYFQIHRKELIPIPHGEPYELTEEEYQIIYSSVQQLYRERLRPIDINPSQLQRLSGFDPKNFKRGLDLLQTERSRQAMDMRQFMRAQQIKLSDKPVTDPVMRMASIYSFELLLSILLMREVISMQCIRVVMKCSKSRALRSICRQIVIDQEQHIHFWCEVLAGIDGRRSRIKRIISSLWLSVLLRKSWKSHRKAFMNQHVSRFLFISRCKGLLKHYETLVLSSQDDGIIVPMKF